jgi:3-dehydroquinate synthetase
MRKDKKVKFGQLRFVGMEAMGRALTLDNVPENLIQELWFSVMPDSEKT